MKILISYGHDQAELIRAIKCDLENLNYTVWLDEYGINAGDDWRQTIESAIMDSSLVLAFISTHSMRDGGVCTDELKIAHAYGCPVRVVLLDNAVKDKIPSFIKHIQYLDFTQFGSANSETKKDLYSAFFKELVDMINSGNYTQHKEITEKLASRLHPDYTMGVTAATVHSQYSKRRWIDEFINTWTTDGTRLSAIIGFPGSGKSCYCAHSFYDPKNIYCVVFCKRLKGKDAVAKVLKNISYQLAMKLFTYAKRLSWILDNSEVDVAEANNSELFDILISEPFSIEIDGGHLPILIVLDGADEITVDGTNALTDLIVEKIDMLPCFIHFIITTRNNPAVTRMLVGRKSVELLPEDKKVSTDIYNYLANALNEHLNVDTAEATLRKLTKKCHGSFLYASLLVEAIASGAITAAEDADMYPERIFDFYHRWMYSIIPNGNEFFEKYYKAFSILIAAKTPVSIRILMRALGWKALDKIKFVSLFRSFLIEGKAFDAEPTIEFFHSSFGEWMSDDSGLADPYCVDPLDGLELYANCLYEEYKSGNIKKSEVTDLISVLLRAHRHKQLLEVARDKKLLMDMVSYAENCQFDSKTYSISVKIFDSIRELSKIDGENTYADLLVSAKIPYLEGAGEFYFGNLKHAQSLIAPAIDNIKKFCTDVEYLDALYILAVVLDWLGDRRGSIKLFRELHRQADKSGAKKYVVRALCGLIWNDHFNNSGEIAFYLKQLNEINDLDEYERLTVNLIKARVMLTLGDLRGSMNLYVATLDEGEEQLWGYDRESVRNQMLMLEVIVACYDNCQYIKASEIGEKIYAHLKGRGNLPECYCASWLAFSYMRAGITEKALTYLQLAEQLNFKSKYAIHSDWMTMHLMSLRNFYELELGNYNVAYERYKESESIAEKCNDAWVAGDACYALFRLHYLFNTEMPNDDMLIYADKLNAIAEASRLPHLKFKASLVNILTGKEKAKPEILTLLLQKQLPSVDIFAELCLCAEISNRYGMAQECEEIKKAIFKNLELVVAENPGSCFVERKTIKTIIERINNGL